jgi:hypothetical protein
MTTNGELIQQTLRLPRGLWADLEETVILHDRQFLTEVARSLGLPVGDVLRRCLGTGAATAVPVLWGSCADGDAGSRCPWWECRGYLWRPCPRPRLSATLPCAIHERSTPCPMALLESDPYLRRLPTYSPIRHEGVLYWWDATAKASPVLREDGSVVPDVKIRRCKHADRSVLVWASVQTKENCQTSEQ